MMAKNKKYYEKRIDFVVEMYKRGELSSEKIRQNKEKLEKLREEYIKAYGETDSIYICKPGFWIFEDILKSATIIEK